MSVVETMAAVLTPETVVGCSLRQGLREQVKGVVVLDTDIEKVIE